MKVSDFRLAAAIVKRICLNNGLAFKDVSITFDETSGDNALIIGNTKNVMHTTYKIIHEYISNSIDIVGQRLFDTSEEEGNFLLTLASKLRMFLYPDNNIYDKLGETTKQSLYSMPLVWILMKDIVCPTNDVSIKNFDIFLVDRNDIDIAQYCADISSISNIDYPFIFVNDIGNNSVQNALLFIEALEAHELSPTKVIKEIYESDLYEKFYGLLELSLTDDEINNFEGILIDITGIDLFDLIPYQINRIRDHKVAQSTKYDAAAGSPFWFIGLTEEMLEPMRGSDWSVYHGLQPYVKEFWDKVEEVKAKRIRKGRDVGVPFNILLELKTKQLGGPESETDTETTLQGLLSSNRVW